MSSYELFSAKIDIALPDFSDFEKQMKSLEKSVSVSVDRIVDSLYDMESAFDGSKDSASSFARYIDNAVNDIRSSANQLGAIDFTSLADSLAKPKVSILAIKNDILKSFQELSEANISLDQDAILNTLRGVATQYGGTLADIQGVIKSYIPQFKNVWAEIADAGVIESKRLYDILVGHSIFPDLHSSILGILRTLNSAAKSVWQEMTLGMVNGANLMSTSAEKSFTAAIEPFKKVPSFTELESAFARLRDRSSTAFFDLKKEFSEINKLDIAGFHKSMEAIDHDIASLQKKISEAVPIQTVLQGGVGFTQIGNATQAQIDGMKAALDSLLAAREELAANNPEAKIVSYYEKLNGAIQAEVDSSVQALTTLRTSTALSGTGISGVFNNIKQGISLASGEGGSKLEGLRRILLGVDDSTSKLGGVFDFAAKAVERFTSEQTKLQRTTEGVINNSLNFVNALEKQVSVVKDIGKSYDVPAKILNDLEQQYNRIIKANKDVAVEFQKTGQISEGTYQRLKIEVSEAQQEIKELSAVAGDSLPPEFKQELDKIINSTSQLDRVTAELGIRQKQLKAEAQQLAAAESEVNQGAGESVSFFGRLKNALSFNFFKTAKDDAKTFEEGLGQVTVQVEQTTGALEGLKSLAVGGLFGGGLVALLTGGLGANIFEGISSQFSNTATEITAALGKPSEEVERFRGIIKDVYANNFGESADQIGSVVQDLIVRFERLGPVTDEEASKYTQNVFRIMDAFQADQTDVIDAASTLVQGFGVSFDQAFDFITGGFQKGLNSSGDLLDSITEYTTQFASGGASIDNFFSILNTGFAGGVLGTDKAADAFKEFRVRIQDGSDTTAKALAQLNINSEDLFAKMADGSVSAAEAFEFVLQALQGVDDQNIRMQAGVGLLGTQYEDLGQNIALGLSLTRGSFDEIEGATARLDARYTTFASTMEQVKRNFQLAFDSTTFTNFFQIVGPILITLSTTISTTIAGITQNLNNFFGQIYTTIYNVINVTGEVTNAFEAFIVAVYSLFTGNWQQAWEFFKLAATNGVNTAISSLLEFIPQAYDWGYSFMSYIGQGIVEAGYEVINAVIDIANQIAAYLQPGSPPKEGPLSTIDEWGEGLVETFDEGLDNADDINFLADLLEGNIDKELPFDLAKEAGTKLIQGLNATGEIDTEAYDTIIDRLTTIEAKTKFANQVKERQKLVKANKELEDAEAAVEEAAKTGYVSKDLQERLDAARQAVAAVQEEKESNDELAQAQDRLAKIGEEDSKKAVAAAVAPSAAATKGLQQQQKTAQDTYNAEIALLDEKLAAGIITEDEYLNSRIKAEEKWFAAEENSDKATTARKVREYQKRLQLIKDNAKAEADAQKESDRLAKKLASDAEKEAKRKGALGALSIPENILQNPLKAVQEDVAQSVEGVKKFFITGMVDTAKEGASSLGTGILDGLKGVFTKVRTYVLGLPDEYIFPFSVIAGIFASPIVYGAFDVLDKIVLGLLRIPKVAPFLVRAFAPLLKIMLRWSVAGYVVYGIFQNWDTIMLEVTNVVEITKDAFTRLWENIVTAYKVFTTNEAAISSIKNIGKIFSFFGSIVSQTVGLILKVFKKGIKVALISIILGAIEFINEFIDAFGGAEKFFTDFATVLDDITSSLADGFQNLNYVLSEIFLGQFDFSALGQALRNIFVDAFSGEALQSFIGNIGTALSVAFASLGDQIRVVLPPDLVDTFDQMSASITGFFDESRLGGQILTLLQELFTGLYTVIVELKDVWIILGVALATVAGVILDAVVAAFQALVAVLPYIESLLVGVIEVIRGVIQVALGVFEVIAALGALLVGDTTGATELFTQALQRMQEGGLLIVQGLVTGIISLVTGLVSFLFSFVGNFVNNIGLVFGEGVQAWTDPFAEMAFTIVDTITALKDSVLEIWNGLVDLTSTILAEGTYGIIDLFWKLGEELVWGSIIPDFVNEIIVWLTETLPQTVIDGITSFASTIVDTLYNMGIDMLSSLTSAFSGGIDFSSLFGGIGDTLGGAVGGVAEGAGGLLSSLFGGAENNTAQFTEMETLFTTFITNITLLLQTFTVFWQETLLLIQTSFTLLVQDFNLQFITTLTSWQEMIILFVQNVLLLTTNMFIQLTNMMNQFRDLVINILQAIIQVIMQVIAAFGQMGAAAIEAGEEVEEGFAKAKESADELERVLDDLILKFQKLEEAAKNAANAANGATSGGGSGMASGGPVSMGQLYTVGERGRELFVPYTDGFIIPNNITDRLLNMDPSNLTQVLHLPVTDEGSQTKQITLQFGDVTINNGMDMKTFEARVITAVRRELR